MTKRQDIIGSRLIIVTGWTFRRGHGNFAADERINEFDFDEEARLPMIASSDST